MKINRIWYLPVLAVIGIVSLSFYAYNQIMTKTTFGEVEIENRVESLFNGEVQTITKTNKQYKVTFLKNDFLYEVSVDEAEGTFHNIKLIKEGKIKEKAEKEEQIQKQEQVVKDEQQANKEQAEQNVIEGSDNSSTKGMEKEEQPEQEKVEVVKPLTEQQIIKIARSKFNGEVDEIQFVGTSDGGYYNVEMEAEEDEATLQIHALTGSVLTITYDD